jgi:hypothetical protein
MLSMPVYTEVHLRCRYLLVLQNIGKKSDTINKNRQCPRISCLTNKIRTVKLGLTTIKIKDVVGLGKLDNRCTKNRETREANMGI